MTYKFWTINSNSEGNCHIVQINNELLLFDIGVDHTVLKTFMIEHQISHPVTNQLHFDKVFISHHHGDHNKGLKDFVYKNTFTFDLLLMPREPGYFFYNPKVKQSFQKQLHEFLNSPHNGLSREKKATIEKFHVLNPNSQIMESKQGIWAFKSQHTNPKNSEHIDNFSYFYQGILYVTDISLSDEMMKAIIEIKNPIHLGMIELNHNLDNYYSGQVTKFNWIGWRSIVDWGHMSDMEFEKVYQVLLAKNPKCFVLGLHQTIRGDLKIKKEWRNMKVSKENLHGYMLTEKNNVVGWRTLMLGGKN